MNVKIPIILTILIIATSLFGESVTILYTTHDDTIAVQKVAEKLARFSDVSTHNIRSTYDISKVFTRKPSLIVIASDSSIATYHRFAPKMKDRIALFLLSSYDYYSRNKNEFSQAMFGIETIGSREQLRALSRFTGDIYPSAGFLYEPSRQKEILFEMNRLRLTGIAPVAVTLADSASSVAVKKAINALSERGVTIVQLAVSDSVYRLLESDPMLVEIVNQHFSAVLSEKHALYSTLENTPVVSINRDYDRYSSIIALGSGIYLNQKKRLPHFTFSPHARKLHYGTVRSEPLATSTDQRDNLAGMIRSVDRSSDDSIWKMIESSLYTEIDTNVAVPAEQFRTIAGMGSGLDQAVLFSITIRDLMIFVAGAILIVIGVDILRKIASALFGVRSVAILYPFHIGNISIERTNRWSIRLKRLLMKEKYRCKSVKTLMQYRNLMAKEAAGIHCIEWNEGSDVIMYLQHIFDKRDDKRTEPVVIFNIPRKHQIELFPRFSKTPLYLYELIPTFDDLERVFYGSGHQEIHVSSIAGSLAEESLPQLLQVLENNRVSGALLIEDPEPFAVIFYRKGVIVNAHDRYGSSVEESIYQSLSKTDGTFRFEKNRHAPAETVQFTSMDVLMSWSAQSEVSVP